MDLLQQRDSYFVEDSYSERHEILISDAGETRFSSSFSSSGWQLREIRRRIEMIERELEEREIREILSIILSILPAETYIFDGHGGCFRKEWNLLEGTNNEFCWHHVELPNLNLSQSAQYFKHCPSLLHLLHQDINKLVSNRSSIRLPAILTENSVITLITKNSVITLSFGGRVPHLLESLSLTDSTMNHSDNSNPKSVSNLVVHIIDTHVDQLQDILTKLEIELDGLDLERCKGGFALTKLRLHDKRLPKMNLHLQRLFQDISHSEELFLRVKSSFKNWFDIEDVNTLEELIGRLRRLKENVDFIANRVTAMLSEQINRRLYYLSLLSMVLMPFFIITGVFGMNVEGVPWTRQKNPLLNDVFRNVLLSTLCLVLSCLLYTRLSAWRSFNSIDALSHHHGSFWNEC